jgi:hypothetical protein
VDPPRYETCATHGLRYDANQHNNCVLCRRLLIGEGREPERSATGRSLISIAGVLGVAGLIVWFGVWARPGSALGPDVPVSQALCLRTLAGDTEKCVQSCAHAVADMCRTDCMNDLNDRLLVCRGLAIPPRSGVQILYSGGSPPSWIQLRDRLQSSLASSWDCGPAFGTLTARLEVRAGQPLAAAAVGMQQRDQAACYVQHLAKLHELTPATADYTVVVRAFPGLGMPQRHEAARPAPAAVAQKPQPSAAPAPKPSVAPQERRASTRLDAASPDDAGALAQLRAAEAPCFSEGSVGCMDALRPLWERFAPLFVSEGISKPVTQYQLNGPGAGFDCVRVDGIERGLQYETALLMAHPTPGDLEWKLIASAYVAPFAGPVDTLGSPWPKNYHSELAHIEGITARQVAVCFRLREPGPRDVYLAMATYSQLDSDKPPEWTQKNERALRAMGLQRGMTARERIEAALWSPASTEQALAAGLSLQATDYPIKRAINHRWPLDKLGILLKAGADPNEVYDEVSAIQRVIGVMSATTPNPVLDRQVADAIKLLVAAGADPNMPTYGGRPLDVAAHYPGAKLTWEALVNAGADPNRTYGERKPPRIAREENRIRLLNAGIKL